MFSSRSFSSEHRSERTVVTEPGRNTKFYLFYEFLALSESASQVSQAEYLNVKKLRYLFRNKINRASLKIQYTFLLQNLHAMFVNLSDVLNVQISPDYNKNNLFILLPDPCLLLVLSLSLWVRNKTYKSSLVRRVYRPKSNGRVRFLSTVSTFDKILKKGILIILERIFELTFQNVFQGFRFNRISHDKSLIPINRRVQGYKLSLLINQLFTVDI